MDLGSLADMASASRRTRIMSEVFSMWQSYTQAMRADLDRDSRFLSPRTEQDDRRLIRHMAVMIGNRQVRAAR